MFALPSWRDCPHIPSSLWAVWTGPWKQWSCDRWGFNIDSVPEYLPSFADRLCGLHRALCLCRNFPGSGGAALVAYTGRSPGELGHEVVNALLCYPMSAHPLSGISSPEHTSSPLALHVERSPLLRQLFSASPSPAHQPPVSTLALKNLGCRV